MNCQQIEKLIHAHLDGELDAANTLEVDAHLADCPACYEAWRRLSALRGALQNQELRFPAPDRLRRNVLAAIQQVEAAEREPVAGRRWFQQAGWAAAAAILLASLLTLHFESSLNREDRLLAELTSSHVRSLMVDHLTDVASTDQHTVKPWFDGKLDFAPPVKDLSDSGFPLVGGRMEFVDGHSAAALVYARQKHFLNLFVWPTKSASPAKPRTAQRKGYNFIQWSDGKMDFGVVSDLNEGELREFVSRWIEK
jgi:anti-sigma factor RsiW